MILLTPLDGWEKAHALLDAGHQVLRIIDWHRSMTDEGLEQTPATAMYMDRDLDRLLHCARRYGAFEPMVCDKGGRHQHVEAKGELLEQLLFTASQYKMEHAA